MSRQLSVVSFQTKIRSQFLTDNRRLATDNYFFATFFFAGAFFGFSSSSG